METIEELVKKRQNEFIEARTITESELTKFLESIKNSDEDIRRRCAYREGITARQLIPALWKEPFDFTEYQKQRADVDAYVKNVYKIFESVNEEARRCLQSM